MERIPQTYKTGHFGMRCIKYMLILINVLYLVISILMLSGATTLKVIFGEYYFELWYASTIDSLSSLWIATGYFLLALSIFGIAAALKESTLMTNFYGLFLALIFILQMAAAILGFTLITQTDGIVGESLNSMMYQSQWSRESTMDWVQRTFQCCGNEGPSDWENFGKYSTPYEYITTQNPDWDSTVTPTTTYPEFFGNRMPKSCCARDSSYDNSSLRCQNYFTRGCHGPLHRIVSESVMMIGSSALGVGIVQILGVICAFMFARTIRRNKTNRDVQRWAIHESMGFDRPAYVDQLGNPETHLDEGKHI